MDFHSLARRDLQTLCKKNRIPANMTNVAMADALQALQSVEGLAEIQEALQFQSPKKLDLASPALPRTSRRATASRKEAVVPKEQQASPLPRARRVTAKKEEVADDAVEKEVAETPKVPNTRRRATAKKEEKPVAGVTAGRRARQSTKKEVEESVMGVDSMMSTGLRRTTRVRGKAAAVPKMASLAKEAGEDKQEKEIEAVVDQKNNLSSEETKEEEKFDKKDCDQKLNLESEAIQEVIISADGSEESSEFVEEEQEKDQEKGEDDALTGFEGSPIRGLISSDQDSNPVAAIENLESAAADDGGFELQEPPLSGESPPETEDSGVQSPSLDIPASSDEQISTVEITAEISTETTESTEDNGELTEEIEDSDEITIETVESGDGNGEITAETTESTEDNGDRDGEITEEGEESTGEDGGELDGLAVDIPVQVDESGGDLESGALAGEISVEAVEAPEPAEVIAGESLDEMIYSISGLNVITKSAGKENSGLTALTAGPAVGGGGGGGAKVKPKAEKLSYDNLSLRKLKAVYKETLVTINNKGEEKRTALRAVDENCI